MRPSFPNATFSLTDFGARGDGRADNTGAFQSAIAACSGSGGGQVTVPAGVWLTGAIRLRSNVNLNLASGATILFSGDARLYPPVLTRYEGIECTNRSPMVYALDETNIALTGSGTLDASWTADWNTGSDRAGVLEPMVAKGLPPSERVVVGRLRSSFVEPYRCASVLIEGVKLVGARFWQLHPTLCTDVTIENVTTSVSGENTDACDPESCDRVVVRHCTLASGDDNLALKSGRDDDGRRVGVACRNVVMMNCQAEGRFGFLTCGSEQTGGIENVYAFNNWTYGHGVGSALWIKSNSQRGGFTRNVRLAAFKGSRLGSAVLAATMTYGDQSGGWLPLFDDIQLADVIVASAPMVVDLQGLAADPIGSVLVTDSVFTGISGPVARIQNAAPVSWSNVTVNGRGIG
jgi:polygalacturonase